MYRYYYTFADVKLQILSDRALTVTPESEPFLTDDPEGVCMTVTIRAADTLPPPPEGGVWDSSRYFAGDAVYHCNGKNHPPYARVTYLLSRDICIEYLPYSGVDLSVTAALVSTLGLESLLLGFDALILHASFIAWKDSGILFSAPSGTGKSTQAALWERYAGAEILNGDRACLRRRPAGWTAYGMPYAGSSDIYRSAAAPVRAIVVLRQASENRIRRMNVREAFACLLPELSLHRWDAAFVNRALDLTTDLLTRIPVYLLECLPDEGAVRLLQSQITKEDGI